MWEGGGVVVSQFVSRAPSGRARAALLKAAAAAGVVVAALAVPSCARAGSATWLAAPPTSNWNSSADWTAGGPPNGPNDVAAFGPTNRPIVLLSPPTEVSGITFNSDARSYALVAPTGLTLTISGTGVTSATGFTEHDIFADGAKVTNGDGGQVVCSAGRCRRRTGRSFTSATALPRRGR
jgi:hypothetical protein